MAGRAKGRGKEGRGDEEGLKRLKMAGGVLVGGVWAILQMAGKRFVGDRQAGNMKHQFSKRK